MKKQSPMQVKVAGKKPMNDMEKYAAKRNAEMASPAAAPGPVEFHDPHMDLHHLMRAEEIKKNPARHRAAKAVAKKKMQSLSSIAK